MPETLTTAQRVVGHIINKQDAEMYGRLREEFPKPGDIIGLDSVGVSLLDSLYSGGLCPKDILNEKTGGIFASVLSVLDGAVATAEDINTLVEERERRVVLAALSKATAQLSAGSRVAEAREALYESCIKSAVGSKHQSWQEYIDDSLVELERQLKYGSELTTGLRELDAMFTMRRRNVTVVAAPTSHGKTAFSLRMVNRAIDAKLKVVYWCFEDWSSIPYKLVSQKYKIPLEYYTKYHLLSPENRAKADSYLNLAKTINGLTVYPEMGYSAFENLVLRAKPDLIVFDYLQRYAEAYGEEGKREACGKAAAQFDKLCKGVNAYGILCSQVRRRERKDGNGPVRPTLYDLKESGDIENYAASVLMLYWPYRDAIDKSRLDRRDYLITVEKDKLGQCGEARVIFDGETQWHRDRV